MQLKQGHLSTKTTRDTDGVTVLGERCRGTFLGGHCRGTLLGRQCWGDNARGHCWGDSAGEEGD